jgi:hypothetical protein
MRPLPVPLFRLELGLRWIARVLSVLLIGLILVIFVGEGFNPFNLKGIEPLQMVLFFTTCIGMVVAWRWELIGGSLSVAAMALFLAVEFGVTSRLPNGLTFYLMLVPGVLFLLSAFLRRRFSEPSKNL